MTSSCPKYCIFHQDYKYHFRSLDYQVLLYLYFSLPPIEVDIGVTPSQPVTVMEEAGNVLTYTLNKTGEAVRNVRVVVNLSGQSVVVHLRLIF